jgi:hypothetical protein
MAKKADLMGLGMPHLIARRMATEPVIIVGEGTTVTTATPIAGDQYLSCVTTSAGSGRNGVLLPAVGGDNGCLLGDDFIINAQTGTSVIVYAANTPGGCAVSISQGAALTTGTTGVSVSVHRTMTLYPITVTTWLGLTN